MKQLMSVGIMALVIIACGHGNWESLNDDNVKVDFTTPQGAVLSLEDAYRSGNIENVVKAKDFRLEAKNMLSKVRKESENDEEMVTKTAEVLELAFRKEIAEKGLPDFVNVHSKFPRMKRINPDLVLLEEVCKYPDGGQSKQILLVGKTKNGWRMIVPESE